MQAQLTREQLFSQGLKALQCSLQLQTAVSSYIPLKLIGLMAGERLTFTLYLKVSEPHEKGFKYFPYIETDEVLDANWLTPLTKLNIGHLYFHQEDLEGVLAYINNHLLVLEVQGPAQAKKKLNVIGEHLILSLRKAFAAPRLGPHIQLAQQQVDRIIKEFQKDRSSLRMVWDILSRNYNLYNHSVNVCLMAVAMMLFLEKSKRDSRLLGCAALFHDLGMTRVSEGILHKSEDLTPEEQEETIAHPTIGMRLLKPHSFVPEDAVRLVWEHHENAAGSGYPQRLSLNQQHPWTRILRLIDAYDALTTHRLYRPTYTPFSALKYLQGQEGPQGPVFEPQTLINFIRFLAIS